MASTPSPIPHRFSPMQHARVWFALVVVFFSLAAGSYYWHEEVQFHTYLAIGAVLLVLGSVPFLVAMFQPKSK